MTTAHQVKPCLKKRVRNEMDKWYRDLFHACDKKNHEKVKELVELEQNNRRAGEWLWDADCFDKEFLEEVSDLLHRAKLLIS